MIPRASGDTERIELLVKSMDGLRIFQIGEEHRQQWDDFVVQSPHFALMQSYEWGEFKRKLGWHIIRFVAQRREQIVAATQLLIKSAPFGLFSVGYVPRGPLVDWQDTETTTALLNALHIEARQHNAVFLKIEPALPYSPQAHQRLLDHGFRATSYTNQPRATLVLDLTQDLDDIFKQMRKKTRQYIRRSVRQGVTVRTGTYQDLSAFYQLMQLTGQRRGFVPRIYDYYKYQWQAFASKKQAVLLMAYFQEKLLAVRTVYSFGVLVLRLMERYNQKLWIDMRTEAAYP